MSCHIFHIYTNGKKNIINRYTEDESCWSKNINKKAKSSKRNRKLWTKTSTDVSLRRKTKAVQGDKKEGVNASIGEETPPQGNIALILLSQHVE